MERIMKSKLFLICILIIATVALATIQDDEKDCADQLPNLASCIPYVGGEEKLPSPQCCADSEKVRSAKPKCLCVLIMESTNPSLGLPINTTLALKMPSACKSDAKVSDCPSILSLPANSPDAKIFQEANEGSSSTSTASSSTTKGSPTADSASTTSSGSSSTSPASSSDSTKATTSSSTNGADKSSLSILAIVGPATIIIAVLLL